ncbi:MAG: cyclic nucleotide-binding domain-containing protein [Treponema sp.]|nr:cyclic nucleotide-binding domain-containing protein [Treponema sp.]
MVLREYSHNSYVCRAGDSAQGMFFIESGMAFVRGNKNQILNELQPGVILGNTPPSPGTNGWRIFRPTGLFRPTSLALRYSTALPAASRRYTAFL